METINERIEAIIKHYKLTANSFSGKLGFPESSTMVRIVKGKISRVSDKTLARIINHFPQINIYWVITGEGDMFRGEEKLVERMDTEINKIIGQLSSIFEQKLTDFKNELTK